MIDDATVRQIQISQQQRRRKQRGNVGEAIVRHRLHAAGFGMIERIHTGYRKVGDRWVPSARVSGDFRAVAPGGISVLVECKVRDRVLSWSDLELHQRDALTHHHSLGGISMLAWIHLPDTDLLRWPIAGFGPGTPLRPEDVIARALRWQP
jgi:hypothetical protein